MLEGAAESRPFLSHCRRFPRGASGPVLCPTRHVAASGLHACVRVSVDGTRTAANRLLDKPLRIATRSGAVVTVVDRQRILLFYVPDFTSVDAHPSYAFRGGHKACEFALRVTDLVKPGQNSVLFEHVAASGVKEKLVVADATFTFREPASAATSEAARARPGRWRSSSRGPSRKPITRCNRCRKRKSK